MTLRPLLRLGLLALVLLTASPALAEDALPLMRQMEEAMKSPGEIVGVQMHLAFADGRTETRTFRMWTRGGGADGARMLLRFESPATIAGTALLMVARKGGGTDSWMYVPALRQTRRIAPQDRSDSFVQSEFTIEDLTVQVDPEHRVYTALGEVACGDGRRCARVEDKPRDEAAAKLSGYGRVVLYLDTEHHVVHRVDFYDKSDGLLKILQAQGLEKAGDGWRFGQASITNVQSGDATVMRVFERTVDPGLDEAVFSPSGLGAL
jgi:hypothetical protein